MGTINQFIGEYRFLSNFYIVPVSYDEYIYPSSENAYQAAKVLDNKLKLEFLSSAMTPAMAKRYARTLRIREDWEHVKDQIMYDIVKSKFTNLRLASMLRQTSPNYLVEGNNWHDIYWGVCQGEHTSTRLPEHRGVPIGQNKLGRILERVRFEIEAV